MSLSILSAIRKNSNLRGSLLLTALELAHRADGNSGHVKMSYSYIAGKCHYSKRTAFRHINRLIGMRIIAVQRFWGPNYKWGVNAYRFLIQWEKPKQFSSARKGSNDNLPAILPTPRNSEENAKYGSLEKEEKAREMVNGWLTPGSRLWEIVNES